MAEFMRKSSAYYLLTLLLHLSSLIAISVPLILKLGDWLILSGMIGGMFAYVFGWQLHYAGVVEDLRENVEGENHGS